MIRPVLTEIGIFLIPFVIYAAFLVASRSPLFASTSWPPPLLGRLTIGALLLVIVSLVLLANFSGSPAGGTYTPAHVENGKLIRGTDK